MFHTYEVIAKIQRRYGYRTVDGGREEISELLKDILVLAKGGALQSRPVLERKLDIFLQQVAHRGVILDEVIKLGIIKFALPSKQCKQVINQAFKDNPKLTSEELFQEMDRKMDDNDWVSQEDEKDNGS
jgi:hypothetical protein